MGVPLLDFQGKKKTCPNGIIFRDCMIERASAKLVSACVGLVDEIPIRYSEPESESDSGFKLVHGGLGDNS
jgi:hypothetical protein